jgi:hypothetical protein
VAFLVAQIEDGPDTHAGEALELRRGGLGSPIEMPVHLMEIRNRRGIGTGECQPGGD